MTARQLVMAPRVAPRVAARRALRLALCIALGLAASCTDTTASSGAAGTPRPAAADRPRIVSLSPAISRTLVDLGLEDHIVGRSMYCSFLDESIPTVGDLLNVDYERLARIDPTHLLVQAPRRGVEPRLEALAAESGWTLAVWTALDTIDDIETLVRDLATMFDGGPGAPGESPSTVAARSATLLNDMAAVLAPRDATSWRGPILLVSQVEPPAVFGRATYLHDVILRLGASNACRADGWVTLSLEDVARLDPEAIVLIKPGADPALDPLELAGPLAHLDIAAVRDGRIALLSHPDALLPSSGIIGVAEEMHAVLRRLGNVRGP